MAADNSVLSALALKLRQGDGKAFEEIYNLTREPAYFTALKISKNEDDAEDILQESYVHLLEKIGSLENPDVFQSWFNQIVANKAKDFLRKKHPERYTNAYFEDDDGEEKFKGDLIEEDNEDFIPESALENTELQKAVMDMIDSLSDDKRTAVILYYYDNMTTKEIAESLGVNENTVKSRIVQAKKDLAKSVTEYEKKHGKLLGVAPMPLVIWALKAAAASAASSSVASGAAAATLATVTAGTAVAGAAAGTAAGVTAGAGIATKIIAGVVAAAIVGGGAIAGTKAAIDNRKKNQPHQTTSVSERAEEPTTKTHKEELLEKYEDIEIPEDKLVDTIFEEEDLGFGVTLRRVNYIYDTPNGREVREGRPVLYSSGFSGDYSELAPVAAQNSSLYSSDISSAISSINSLRGSNGAAPLAVDPKLSEQAGVRAAEMALSGKVNPIRPDGTNYTSVFDRNGYTSGTRKELRAWRCNSPDDAIKKWQSDGALSDDSVEKIGIGVAKDPKTDDYIYVAHLYSDKGSNQNESPSLVDRIKDRQSSRLIRMIGSVGEAEDRLSEIEENASDIPVIGDILTYDFHNDAIMMALQSGTENLIEWLNDTVDGV